MWPRYQVDPCAALDREGFCIWMTFTFICGRCGVFVSGFIMILFKTHADIAKSWLEDGFASEFGNLRLCYDVPEVESTQNVLPGGWQWPRSRMARQRGVTLGPKIRFPNDQNGIPVPTHAFVTFRTITTSPMLRIANWYAQIKRKLARLHPSEEARMSQPLGHPGINQRVIRP
ncbi:hypothetical protein CNMCM6936_005502 [Aspergillus lentulus]|nr:hypothetical protein CNMCM6936_005502 [Aspergillus lentulus]KAF4173866.1 hypothetical protein CNMCM8060_009414 [Aspergillus lentulus]KAF4184696.1 hypothetical protein CNMCM7927_007638 [Aspergillus lentulus]KAF4193391.1 hypothetical protein CNMCM8694_008919 [Aspergillus lentulus]